MSFSNTIYKGKQSIYRRIPLMSSKKFKFVSPGIFLSEVDNSQLPAEAEAMGPVIIGRTAYGPSMRPTKVNSFSEFVETFGNPIPGSQGGDTWRLGNLAGPTYAAYAAQAYLRAGVGPVTMIRLAGQEHSSPTLTGYAGWETTNATAATASGSNGGAYGLYLMSGSVSGSAGGAQDVTGTLAAIFYVNDGGGLALTGTLDDGSTTATGSQAIFVTSSTEFPGSWKMEIYSSDSDKKLTTEFNFDPASNKFVRNVFNTNPMLVNDAIVDPTSLGQGQSVYWLGESFENSINSSALTYEYATLIPLENSDNKNRAAMKLESTPATTGWFFSQDLTTDNADYTYAKMQNLFKFHALDGGDWSQNNLKISIKDLKYSRNTDPANAYGSFTVLVRRASDNDNAVQIVEQYTNCNLNPASDDYIGAKIGDKKYVWDEAQQRLKEVGEFNNNSKYIRVEIDSEIASGRADARLLPYGVYGPTKLKDIILKPTGTLGDEGFTTSSADEYAGDESYLGRATVTGAVLSSSYAGIHDDTRILLEMPKIATRVSASDGGISDPKNAYFGVQSTYDDTLRHDAGYGDYLRPLPAGTEADTQFTFTLDEVVTSGETAVAVVGSRASGSSATTGPDGWKEIIDDGYTRFTTPLFGGFEGVDIREMEPFRNSLLKDKSDRSSYAYNTVKRAIDTVSDPEYTECNLITMPGLTEDTLTSHILTTCEDRADALALFDLESTFYPETEGKDYKNFEDRAQPVASAINDFEDRQINSSYGCTYYPWTQIRDSISGQMLWAPPSIVALGTFASSEAKSEIWFAPAGFNRGGLTEGSAGLPVISVSRKLTSKDRDDLYEANINPIASFPSEGLVVFGQKTTQQTPSALDRINVRRMMIYVKKEISRIAAGILFDQNVKTTWNRFLGEVNPFLASVQSRLGLTEYKVILDETTTTPDLVDRNILYAKIFLKPARAIEFIAIDFVITRSGASFED